MKTKKTFEGQTAKILTLSSGNVGKFGFLTGKDVLPGKVLLKLLQSKDWNNHHYVVNKTN